MKIALICDMHISNTSKSPQWNFFIRAVEQMEKDNISTVICLGDITSYGEYDVFEEYTKRISQFSQYTLLGNSDVRNPQTEQGITESSTGFELAVNGKNIIGINTPYAIISEADRKRLEKACDNDIIMLHHSIYALSDKDREFITGLAGEKALTIIHAHSHKHMDYYLGESRVIGLRALDPDKSIGDYPCITYFETDSCIYEEKIFDISAETVRDVNRYFGISCVDNHRDVKYAAENKVYAVELRCNNKEWVPDYTLTPIIENWRRSTNGYLSVHMPNLYWKDGKVCGAEQWYEAVHYAKNIGANGLTMHPPRAKKCDMKDAWEELLKLYTYAVTVIGENVNIGIENLHMNGKETDNEECSFGYVPEEVCTWIDAINEKLGSTDRVKHTLDVGHARNNGVFAKKYPISRWYEIMGGRTVAYHIHQVIKGENKIKNHTAIADWFGPMISYASFFYCWEKNIINHVPIFLEVRGCENYEISMKAFKEKFI